MRTNRLLTILMALLLTCALALAEGEWQCACGMTNEENACADCGKERQTLQGEMDAALTLMAEGNYDEAALALDLLGQFEGAAAKWQECQYLWGLKLEADGEYMTATEKFQAAGDYADAGDKVMEMAYAQAEKCLEEGDYEFAMELYMLLYGYRDADQKVLETTYRLGEKYLAEGAYEDALRCFNDTPDHEGVGEKIMACELGVAKELIDAGEEDAAYDMLVALNGYGDSLEQLKRIYYNRGMRLVAEGEKELALEPLAMAGDYEDAAQQLSQLCYEIGLTYCEKEDYPTAMKILALAGDHEEAVKKLGELHDMLIKDYLAKGEVNVSIALYKQAAVGGYQVEDVIALSPEDTGNAAAGVLNLAKSMGYVKKLSKNETTYKEKYVKGIMSMEKKLGLTEDGVLRMSELYAMTEAIYPGSNLQHTADVFMMLDDLNYINIDYNDRTTYKSKYKSGIKKAEKKLGLTADGIITMEEQKVILAQQPEKPDAVKSLKVKTAKVKKEPNARKVTLSWPKVKNTTFYIIYRDGIRVALTTGTKYELKMYEGLPGSTFQILAEKYTVAADGFSPEQFVEIPLPEKKD